MDGKEDEVVNMLLEAVSVLQAHDSASEQVIDLYAELAIILEAKGQLEESERLWTASLDALKRNRAVGDPMNWSVFRALVRSWPHPMYFCL